MSGETTEAGTLVPTAELALEHFDYGDGQIGVRATIPHPFWGRTSVDWMRLLKDGEIANVEVLEEYRRRGVATALLRHLEAAGIAFYHQERLFADGSAWVSSL